jgi:hypothetical protein
MKAKFIAATMFSIYVIQVASSLADAQTLRERLREGIRDRIVDRSDDSPAIARQPSDDSKDLPHGDESIFQDGANCLFIGHSFFIPVAKSFDKIAARSELTSHQARFVFSPGLGGSPRGLWENERRRQQVEKVLASGTVELL